MSIQSPNDSILPAMMSPAEERKRDRRRRQREMFFAAAAFVLFLALTSWQMRLFRTGDFLFMAVFSINVVLLLGILVVVLRNGFKLLLERRRHVLGSRLRTRLVAAFLVFSLLPCVLMLLVTTRYVQLSMDFWFRDQIEASMEAATELVANVYENMGLAMVGQARNIKAEIRERNFSWGGSDMGALMERKRQEYGAALTGYFDAERQERNWHATAGVGQAWEAARGRINWNQAASRGYAYVLATGRDQDYVIAVLTLEGSGGYMVQGYGLGEGFIAGAERIVSGTREYRTLRAMRRPLKRMLDSSLGVLTGLIALAAVWFGFRLARELTAPIFALAVGTERIAKGDLSVRLNDTSQDEFGALIRSFNRMAEDLESSRHETTSAYSLLEERNRQTARHSKYMETVLNNIAAGVISVDAEGRVSTVNGAACEILALEKEGMLGKPVEDLLPPPLGDIAKSVHERFRHRQDYRTQHSVSVPIAGEERRLLMNVVGFSTDGVYQGAVAVFEDISELEHMQRLAAWREVARRIAHEIKNPLTPIKLSAQRLAKKFGGQVDSPAFSQSTELIVRQVEYLQNMVQEFSAFAKLPEVKPMPDRLEPLLQTITDLFRNSHSGIAWELSVPADLPTLPMDKEALHRAFMNILGNAAEALSPGGTEHPTVWIQASFQPALNLVRIDVADNGPGLSEEERSRLFEPYFSRKKGGTGLGLTIVRSIVADHRGYVRAFSREGGGTVLSMELPLA
jgi:two-component system nitrogen regulation sensor histidine kinase NtrY